MLMRDHLALLSMLKSNTTPMSSALDADRATPPRLRALAAALVSGTCLAAAAPVFAQGGDTQELATCITSIPAGGFTVTGTTVGAADNYDLPPDTTSPTLTATCATGVGRGPAGSLPAGAVYTGTGTAPDVVYRMDFPSGNPDTMTITLTPTGPQDLALIVYCDQVSSALSDGLAISDTGVGGGSEVVTVSNVVAGTSLYIVVDGYSTGGTPPGPAGPYSLNITSNGTTQPAAACGVVPGADVSATKTVAGNFSPGGTLTYTVTLTNSGTADQADNAGNEFIDVLPVGVTLVSATATSGTAVATTGTNTVTWNGAIPQTGTVTLTITATVDANATGMISNQGTVNFDSDGNNTNDATALTDDPAVGGASDPTTFTVAAPSADLSITKTDGVATVAPGGTLAYQIVVSNAGPSNEPAALVTDSFPALCSSVSWTCSTTGGATCLASGSGNISETVGLPSGATATFAASCTVSATAPDGSVITNTATVSATSDSTPANNTASDTTTVVVPPSALLSATKSVSGVFEWGGTVNYAIVISNTGTGAQGDNPGDEFIDVLPSGVQLLSATASGGTVVANVGTNTVTWNGGIAPSASVSLNIEAQVNATVGSTISNQGTVHFDGNADGVNESTALTDDPAVAGPGNPTSFTVRLSPLARPAVVPTLSHWGQALVLMLIGAFGVLTLRRRG